MTGIAVGPPWKVRPAPTATASATSSSGSAFSRYRVFVAADRCSFGTVGSWCAAGNGRPPSVANGWGPNPVVHRRRQTGERGKKRDWNALRGCGADRRPTNGESGPPAAQRASTNGAAGLSTPCEVQVLHPAGGDLVRTSNGEIVGWRFTWAAPGSRQKVAGVRPARSGARPV